MKEGSGFIERGEWLQLQEKTRRSGKVNLWEFVLEKTGRSVFLFMLFAFVTIFIAHDVFFNVKNPKLICGY